MGSNPTFDIFCFSLFFRFYHPLEIFLWASPLEFYEEGECLIASVWLHIFSEFNEPCFPFEDETSTG